MSDDARPRTVRRPARAANLAAAKTQRDAKGPHAPARRRGLKKSYRKGQVEIPVLRGVDLEVRRGEFLAIVGQSGSGKSTLLHLLGTLDAPDAGEIHFEGRRIDNLPARRRDCLRNRQFGMIFQFYHLLPELTTLENVLSPLMIAESSLVAIGDSARRTWPSATELLELVGLAHRLKHKPRELSGGEMQRAAIARALDQRPASAAGRRADRQPRPRDRARDPRHSLEAEPPAGPDDRDGDARPRHRLAGRSHGAAG